MDEEKFYEVVGELITKERLRAGVKQEDMANFLELSRASVVNIEKGRQRPSMFMLLNIAKYLNLDFSKLIPSNEFKQSFKTLDVSFNMSSITTAESDLNSVSEKSIKDFLSLIKK